MAQPNPNDIAMEGDDDGDAKEISRLLEEDIEIQQRLLKELMLSVIITMCLGERYDGFSKFLRRMEGNTDQYVQAYHDNDDQKKDEAAGQIGFMMAHLMQDIFNIKNNKFWKPLVMKYVKKQVMETMRMRMTMIIKMLRIMIMCMEMIMIWMLTEHWL